MARMNNSGRTFAAYGDSANHNVRELQQVLQQLGVYSGAVTGTFDDATYQAYRQACRAAHLPVSRDKKGRLVVTLGDFEALEQLDGGAVAFAAAETQVEAEDDFAKRPVDSSELEEDSAKYPSIVNRNSPGWQRKWVLLGIATCIAAVIGLVLLSRPSHKPRNEEVGSSSISSRQAVLPSPLQPTTPPDWFSGEEAVEPLEYYTPDRGANSDVVVLSEGVRVGDYSITTYSDTTCTITHCFFDYSTSSQNMTIPAKLNGYKVTAIGDSTFSGLYGLRSISIPNGVISIGSRAFTGCYDLKSITIPDSVTHIGDEILTSAFTPPTFYVTENSYAHQYCIDNNLPYVLQ